MFMLTLVNSLELELDEEGTRISLTIVDTPGFGDSINNEERYAIFLVFFFLPFLFELKKKKRMVKNNITNLLYQSPASVKSSATSNANTTTFSPRSHESSVTLDSATIVSTPFSTSSPQQATVSAS